MGQPWALPSPGPQAALQRHPWKGVKWGSHCWPPHGRPRAHRPQRMEPGKQRARAAGRGERAPFPQHRPPAGFRAPRSGLRRIRPPPPLKLTVHPSNTVTRDRVSHQGWGTCIFTPNCSLLRHSRWGRGRRAGSPPNPGFQAGTELGSFPRLEPWVSGSAPSSTTTRLCRGHHPPAESGHRTHRGLPLLSPRRALRPPPRPGPQGPQAQHTQMGRASLGRPRLRSCLGTPRTKGRHPSWNGQLKCPEQQGEHALHSLSVLPQPVKLPARLFRLQGRTPPSGLWSAGSPGPGCAGTAPKGTSAAPASTRSRPARAAGSTCCR